MGFVSAVVLFALPWVEVRMAGPAGILAALPGVSSPVWVRQSGVQVAVGAATFHPGVEAARSGPIWVGPPGSGPAPPPIEVKSAAWLWLCPVLAATGAVLVAVARKPDLRRLLTSCCAGLALLVVLAQVSIGFPLERDLGSNLTGGGPFAFMTAFMVTVSYTGWLYMAVMALIAAGAAPWVEHAVWGGP